MWSKTPSPLQSLATSKEFMEGGDMSVNVEPALERAELSTEAAGQLSF